MEKPLSWDELKVNYSEEELARPNIYNQDKENNSEDEEGEGKGGGKDVSSPVPAWVIEERVRFSNWKYIPEKEIIMNIKIQKQVELMKLSSSYIILNFIQSLSLRPELELDNFIIELERACYLKYKKSLFETIEAHLDTSLLWDMEKENFLNNRRKDHIFLENSKVKSKK